ncbi:MAG: hypothetical protein HGA42_00565 [Nostocales cyanobacterium W4_Combined_metabat2_030]|nr:hypothetical protein [Nostocales cyanobacterium W4_Combined_metabat2_030]
MIKEYIKRFKHPMPAFFKKLVRWVGSLGAVSLAILTANTMYNLELNDYFVTGCKYLLILAIASVGTAKATTANESLFGKSYGGEDERKS